MSPSTDTRARLYLENYACELHKFYTIVCIISRRKNRAVPCIFPLSLHFTRFPILQCPEQCSRHCSEPASSPIPTFAAACCTDNVKWRKFSVHRYSPVDISVAIIAIAMIFSPPRCRIQDAKIDTFRVIVRCMERAHGRQDQSASFSRKLVSQPFQY